jgi:hypothetical protein
MRNELRLHRGQLQRRDYRPKGNPFKVLTPVWMWAAFWLIVGGCAVLGALFLALAVVTK